MRILVIDSLRTYFTFPAVTWKILFDHFLIFNTLVMQLTPSRAKCQHNYCFRVFWYVCLYAYPKHVLGGGTVVLVFETLYQGYSIILRKGPVTNVKIFRGPVTPTKSCKCDMSWIFLTKNVI